jgi:hypothetical protein
MWTSEDHKSIVGYLMMAKLLKNNLQQAQDNKSFNYLYQLLKIEDSDWNYT